jgi:hypothetical protein
MFSWRHKSDFRSFQAHLLLGKIHTELEEIQQAEESFKQYATAHHEGLYGYTQWTSIYK